MKTREHLFLDRPKLRFIDTIFYQGNDVGFSSYGDNWRYMKSICVMELLSNKRVESFRSIREEEVARLIKEIKLSSNNIGSSSAFNLSEISSALFKGLICRTALGRKYDDRESGKEDIYGMFKELADVMGEVSVGDYIPFLAWIDTFTGLENRVANVHKQFDAFIEQIVQDHEIRFNNTDDDDDDDDKDAAHGNNNVQDFVDVLLKIQRENPQQLSRDNIKGVILVSHSF